MNKKYLNKKKINLLNYKLFIIIIILLVSLFFFLNMKILLIYQLIILKISLKNITIISK